MKIWKIELTEKLLLLILVLATIANIVIYTILNPIVLEMAVGDVVYRNIKNSPSMNPLMDKNIFPDLMVKTIPVDSDDELYLGKIYIYKRLEENKTEHIMHRLVGIFEIEEENIYIFKGDNNEFIDRDPVSRYQIFEEVVGVSFG